MAGTSFVRPQWFHLPLTAVGLLVLLGVVGATLVALSIVFYLLLGLLFGVPLAFVVGELSISRIAADRASEPLAWLAGVLLCIVSIPWFDRYHRWLGRVLRETNVDTDTED
ncbi:hypothetical protein [Natronorubrum texcoconense]|uniref:Uncharacterized protein n=1 Tax=Natronorubrum texcoconense TaxID=1095776 RepID=A0A1G9B5E9_9EURY|nr:hypothetical protein [Natronorubrum texcoconense]SDK34723.1 hypothetical protein SAMN04515672_2828 [Natronorubrum texcoconense]